jgi:hypothetical protein
VVGRAAHTRTHAHTHTHTDRTKVACANSLQKVARESCALFFKVQVILRSMKATMGGGEGRGAAFRVAPRGGKGKAPVDDTTVRKHKRARAARKVTPVGGEASGERSVAQAAEGPPHGLASRGQGGAAGGLASQQPALQAADTAMTLCVRLTHR